MNKEQVENIKKMYPIGFRVELIKMDDIQAPPAGTLGTIKHVDDIGTIFIDWDNGSSLGVVLDEDEIKVLSVATSVYGRERTWNNQDEAIKFFTECLLCSEGAEKRRYEIVLNKLKAGLLFADDEETETSKKSDLKICPNCGKAYKGYPAISRIDNKTEICPECGIKEALDAYKKSQSK